jgi:hypothetical protein
VHDFTGTLAYTGVTFYYVRVNFVQKSIDILLLLHCLQSQYGVISYFSLTYVLGWGRGDVEEKLQK